MLEATIALGVATFLLVIVTWLLSKTTKRQTDLIKRQTDILQENQQITVNRDQAKLLLEHSDYYARLMAKNGCTYTNFDGCTITNAGKVNVTITCIGVAFAVPADDPNPSLRQSLQLAPKDWKGFGLGGDDIPVKLKPGDTAKYMFFSHDLESVNRPFQFRCKDSLGNTYQTEGWRKRSQNKLTFMYLGDDFNEPDPNFQVYLTSRSE